MSNSKKWLAKMPSNIALIKYMGKKDIENNVPTNSSLSWTLNHLVTSVEVSLVDTDSDQWSPLESDFPIELSQKGKEKYLSHVDRMKKFFGITDHFLIRSGNNFPADCGIASSASSFAALTEACSQAFTELSGKEISIQDKALQSAKGSGSSCRSFYDGLVLWEESGVKPVKTDLEDLLHMVVIVGGGTKEVSSSDAHKMVQSSALFLGRVERCNQRLESLMASLSPLDWKQAYQIVWAEFWDMHALFETSKPPFGYFLPGTFEVLDQARKFWSNNGDGPIVTMDAGPNVHLLWREDQKNLATQFYQENLKSKWTCLCNIPEIGFVQV